MTKEIKVYSKNNCPQCMFTKMMLNNEGHEYTEVNIDEDKEARDELVSKGYRSAPVVFVGEDVVVGNNPGLLKQLLA